MFIADGHADSLMWNRDLTQRSDEGHVDFPRLKEAGVRIQCFTVVTRGLPFVNLMSAFAVYRRWPAEARRGEWARASWQIDRLHELCGRSKDEACVTVSAAALEQNIAAGRLSAVLGIEGAHAIEGKVERVKELHARGVRFMGLTHLHNNELGGSSFPLMGNRPLTPLGREVLDEMASLGMSLDVAHASERTLAELLAHRTARPFCSHTGVRSAGGGWRNLPDPALRTIADKGGVVGIIFATVYLGGSQLSDVARHIEHAINVMGEDGVALGSDFDGMIPLPQGMTDVRDVPRLAHTLAARGHPEARIEKVLFGNFRRFFRETLDRG
jgi:membrane dipeptidase